MSWSFNPFTGNLDLTGSSGAVVFEGEVETFADLSETIGDPAVGASFLVRSSTGVWLVNRRQAGIWIRRNNTGVRATDWEYGGDYPVTSVNGQTGNVSLTASSIGAQSSFVSESLTITIATPIDLAANRAKIWETYTFVAGTVRLPETGSIEGDIFVFRWLGGSENLSIEHFLGSFQQLATLSPGETKRFIKNVAGEAGWLPMPVDTHTHTASQITDFAQAAQDYTVVSTAQTLTVGAKVAADTTAGAFTLTLPATPATGDTVSILDYAGTFDTNNLTIARNGSNIESLAEDMDCNIEDAAFSLVFVGSTVGWKVVPLSGTAIAGVISNPAGVAGADAITNMMSLTQAEYNAIGSPDPTTLFIITDP